MTDPALAGQIEALQIALEAKSERVNELQAKLALAEAELAEARTSRDNWALRAGRIAEVRQEPGLAMQTRPEESEQPEQPLIDPKFMGEFFSRFFGQQAPAVTLGEPEPAKGLTEGEPSRARVRDKEKDEK